MTTVFVETATPTLVGAKVRVSQSQKTRSPGDTAAGSTRTPHAACPESLSGSRTTTGSAAGSAG
ncbi:hypothetical protein ACFYO1_02305 [Nocardia sp. NPDC006044]|uniref:hypothetical protein n=1 Tax=Nocardia sp. NPDC006044 TaxID=3364306 RepID=UPI0036882799